MARDEWFRNDRWDAAEEAEFRARLARCRTEWNRSQYLRLKALALLETGDTAKVNVARDLLVEWFDTASDDDIQVTIAHQHLADAHERLGDHDAALREHELAVEAELDPTHNNFKTLSILELACCEFRLRGALRDTTLESLLAEPERDKTIMTFPATRFRFAEVIAQECHRRGDAETARAWARQALEAADVPAPFTRHKDVGLAKISPTQRRRLESLAGIRRRFLRR